MGVPCSMIRFGWATDMSGLLILGAIIVGIWLVSVLFDPRTQVDRDNMRPEIQKAKIARRIAYQDQWRSFEGRQSKPANMPDEVWDAGLTDVYRKAFREHCAANPIGRGERV